MVADIPPRNTLALSPIRDIPHRCQTMILMQLKWHDLLQPKDQVCVFVYSSPEMQDFFIKIALSFLPPYTLRHQNVSMMVIRA